MMSIAVLVYLLAIREGLLKEKQSGIRGGGKDKSSGFEYRAVYVFLKGLDILRRKVLNLAQLSTRTKLITPFHLAAFAPSQR